MSGFLELAQEHLPRPYYIVLTVTLTVIGLLYFVQPMPLEEAILDRKYWYIIATSAYVCSLLLITQFSRPPRFVPGALGIVVARLENDPKRTVQKRLINIIRTAAIEGKNGSNERVQVLDLMRAIGDGRDVEKIARDLNAKILVWGGPVILEESTVFLRIWSEGSGNGLNSTVVDTTELTELNGFRKTVENEMIQSIQSSKNIDKPDSIHNDTGDISNLHISGENAIKPRRVSAILIGVGGAVGQVSTEAAQNNVDAIEVSLRRRYGEIEIRRLLNEEVTEETLSEAFQDIITHMTIDDLLFLYFNGNTRRNRMGKSFFCLSDQSEIMIGTYINQAMNVHDRTLLVVDGGYSPILAQSPYSLTTVIGAGMDETSIQQLQFNGKNMGAFTQHFVQALTSLPNDIGVHASKLFEKTSTGLPPGVPYIWARMYPLSI